MTPDDLTLVRRSWTELRKQRERFIERFEAALDPIAGTTTADHAHRIVESADELVDTLATPSYLGIRARAVVATWPPSTPLPRLDVDEVAWRRAAAEVSSTWSDAVDTAWHRAWLLLADALADDSTSPFDAVRVDDDVTRPPRT